MARRARHRRHEHLKKHPSLTYIPGNWVEAIVEVPYGAHPAACDTLYDEDDAHMRDYIARSKTADGIKAYLDEFARALPDHAAYLDKCGGLGALAALDVKGRR